MVLVLSFLCCTSVRVRLNFIFQIFSFIAISDFLYFHVFGSFKSLTDVNVAFDRKYRRANNYFIL